MSDAGRMGHLVVEGPSSAAEIVLLDGSLDRVARTVGRFEGDLPPGLYRVAARIGTRAEQRHVLVAAGQTAKVQRVNWTLKFDSVAPLDGSATTIEAHQEFAARWSRQRTSPRTTGDCRLFLFARSTGVSSIVGFDGARRSHLALHNTEGALVSALDDGDVRVDASANSLAYTADLRGGGYRLRYGISGQGPGDTVLAERPLWLCPEFELHIFATWIDDGRSPAFSTSLVPRGAGFAPRDKDAQRDVKIAEFVLDGIQRGQCLLPRQDRERLLRGDLSNPWLGIVGAHALRLERPSDPDVLASAVGRLSEKLGDHPDVVALRIAIGDPVQTLTFPPMLRSGLSIVREASTGREGLARGMLFDALIGGSVAAGPWTAWRLDAVPLRRTAVERAIRGAVGGTVDLVRKALPALARRVPALQASATQTGATQGLTIDMETLDALVTWLAEGLGTDRARLDNHDVKAAIGSAFSAEGVRILAANLHVQSELASMIMDATVRAVRNVGDAGARTAPGIYEFAGRLLDDGVRRFAPSAKAFLVDQVQAYLLALVRPKLPDVELGLADVIEEDARRLVAMTSPEKPERDVALVLIGLLKGLRSGTPLAVSAEDKVLWSHPTLGQPDPPSDGPPPAGSETEIIPVGDGLIRVALQTEGDRQGGVGIDLASADLDRMAATLRLAVRGLQADIRRRIADPSDPLSRPSDLPPADFAAAGRAAQDVIAALAPPVGGTGPT